MTYPSTGWFEVKDVKDKSAKESMNTFDDVWLSRYPRPEYKRENASRISHDYKVGDKILLKKPGKHLRKLEAPRPGPHTVTAIYTNGTVRIQKGKVNERLNIRRFFPYFENAYH
jgi:hypothetical protein